MRENLHKFQIWLKGSIILHHSKSFSPDKAVRIGSCREESIHSHSHNLNYSAQHKTVRTHLSKSKRKKNEQNKYRRSRRYIFSYFIELMTDLKTGKQVYSHIVTKFEAIDKDTAIHCHYYYLLFTNHTVLLVFCCLFSLRLWRREYSSVNQLVAQSHSSSRKVRCRVRNV